jgi:hypothetical protein
MTELLTSIVAQEEYPSTSVLPSFFKEKISTILIVIKRMF